MQITVKFSFHTKKQRAEKIYQKLGRVREDKGMGDTFHVIDVFKDSPEYKKLVFELRKNFISYNTWEDYIYTEEELLVYPVLRIVPNAYRGGYPKPDTGSPDKNYSSVSFDMDTDCEYCKGRIQNRPLQLKRSIQMGKADITGVWWVGGLIITKKLKEIIESEKLTGCEIWPLIQYGRNEYFENIFQLKITGEMPPMDRKTKIRHKKKAIGCKCGENRAELPVYYRSEDLKGVSDFALTREWVGSMLYWRSSFLSQKAYKVFLDNKIKGVRFYPPIIV